MTMIPYPESCVCGACDWEESRFGGLMCFECGHYRPPDPEPDPCYECGEPLRPSDGRQMCIDCVRDFGGVDLDTRPEDRAEAARIRWLNMVSCKSIALWKYQRSRQRGFLDRANEYAARANSAWGWRMAWESVMESVSRHA